jgi:hypothetical protein
MPRQLAAEPPHLAVSQLRGRAPRAKQVGDDGRRGPLSFGESLAAAPSRLTASYWRRSRPRR